MAAHEAAHQAVLQLFEPPDLRKLVALAGEQLLAQRRNGEQVAQGSIGIERQCLDCPELSARLSNDRRRSPSRAAAAVTAPASFRSVLRLPSIFPSLLSCDHASSQLRASGPPSRPIMPP